MTYLLLQTFLLLLASYFAGAFVACLAKRALFGSDIETAADVLAPTQVDAPVRPPIVMPPRPVRARSAAPIGPRAIDPVQPKIEVMRRPEPRVAPAVLDPSRFERALIGPDPNEGVPRIAIAEIRPSVLPPVTDIYVPRPPDPPPPPPIEEPPPEIPVVEETSDLPEVIAEAKTQPRAGGLAARLRDATTAAAAGAVAAAKAAAAASVAFPGMGTSRRAPVEETVAERPASDAVEEYPKAGDASIASDAVSAADTAQASERLREVHAGTSPAGGEEQWVVDGGATPEPVPELEPEQEIAPSDPAPEPAFVPAAAASAPVLVTPAAIIEGGDDFQRIRAIDVDIEQKLKARGITYFEHIAGWSSSDIRRIGQELEIPGRIDREQWIEQAQILAKGGDTYYSRNRKAMLGKAGSSEMEAEVRRGSASASVPEVEHQSSTPHVTKPGSDRDRSSGVVAASQGRSVAEMAAAAAAAIAAASASVTRGLRPIEPISPLSKVDPKISIPARITDAIREKKTATATVEITKDGLKTDVDGNGSSDDLKRIRGVGVLIEKRLNAMGIRRYEQIANWTSGDIDRVSRMLEFKGRIERESWVEQARILASGGQTEFSRRVDKGEVDTSRET